MEVNCRREPAWSQDIALFQGIFRIRFPIPPDLLPGSLSLTHRRCGQPTCYCAKDKMGHPVWSLTFMAGGKKRVEHIPNELVVRQSCAVYPSDADPKLGCHIEHRPSFPFIVVACVCQRIFVLASAFSLYFAFGMTWERLAEVQA
jgi:hypothetical protein